jgi:hypothetical protein
LPQGVCGPKKSITNDSLWQDAEKSGVIPASFCRLIGNKIMTDLLNARTRHQSKFELAQI